MAFRRAVNRRLAQNRTKTKKIIPTAKPTIKPRKAKNTRDIFEYQKAARV